MGLWINKLLPYEFLYFAMSEVHGSYKWLNLRLRKSKVAEFKNILVCSVDAFLFANACGRNWLLSVICVFISSKGIASRFNS